MRTGVNPGGYRGVAPPRSAWPARSVVASHRCPGCKELVGRPFVGISLRSFFFRSDRGAVGTERAPERVRRAYVRGSFQADRMARNARSAVRQWSVRPLRGDAAWSRIEHTTRHTAIKDTPDYDPISRSQGGCYVPLVCYRGGAYRKARQSGQVLTTTVRCFTLCR